MNKLLPVSTAFILGTSTVITLPKSLEIVPGTRIEFLKKPYGMQMRKLKSRHVSAQEKSTTLKKKVQRLAGGLDGLFTHVTPEDMTRVYDEEVYHA
ncbi:MAG: hypothetical protein AAB612_00965 [Patescibacteria group bacterium]